MFIKCEIKKILEKKHYRIFLAAGLLLNLCFSIYNCQKLTSDPVYQAKEALIQEHGGRLTREKVNWIFERYDLLSEKVAAGSLNQEYDEQYYTGYVFGDSQIMEEVYSRLLEIQYYPETIAKIYTDLKQSEELYRSVGNEKMAEVYASMSGGYEKRTVTYLQDELLVTNFLNNRVSIFLSILFTLLIFTGSISIDRETEMNQLIRTTIKGRDALPFKKPLAAMILSGFVTLLFYVEDIFVYGILYHGFSFIDPLYNWKAYEETFFEGTILEFLIQAGMIRIIGIVIMGMLCGIIAMLVRSDTGGLFLCLGLVFVFLLQIPWINPWEAQNWNPLSALVGMEWYKHPEVVTVGSEKILYPYAKIGVQIVYGLAAYIGMVIIGVRKERLC